MTLRYKGYLGKAEIDENEKAIVGRVVNMARDGTSALLLTIIWLGLRRRDSSR